MSDWISTPESSNIAGFCYDESSEILTVEFNNGTKYDYFDVPENIGNGMENAESRGAYLNKEIKGKYRYARV